MPLALATLPALHALVHVLAPAARCADISFTPSEKLQIVAWVETSTGQYVDTVYMTQATGRFGLGNRPGRYDFNSGPMFPYGRRTPTFPVWAHRHGRTFPSVIFRNSPDNPDDCELLVNGDSERDFANCGENNLSHPFSHSSRETWYCQPLLPDSFEWIEADAMTCATAAFTDKGRLSPSSTSLYPPRADLAVAQPADLPSVMLYRMMNPFDAISQATPAAGSVADVAWPVADTIGEGTYVLWVEVSKERDHNETYSVIAYPAPPSTGPKGISWAAYGLPYRGQPSVLYKVPFTVGPDLTTASTIDYAGYGAPDGSDGAIRPPDATITTDRPGSGASRLQLVSEDDLMYRVRIRVRPNLGSSPPGAPIDLAPSMVEPSRVTMSFIAPDVGGAPVAGYDVRISANVPITAATFDDAMPITTVVPAKAPGEVQVFEVLGLLPETEYYVAMRAYDACKNASDVTVAKLTTADRALGTVDACFVATAAYGSLMASDVELLRHVRDAVLQRTVFGELAVESYYTFGPLAASLVAESDLLRRSARAALTPVIARVRRLRY